MRFLLIATETATGRTVYFVKGTWTSIRANATRFTRGKAHEKLESARVKFAGLIGDITIVVA